MAYYVVGNYTGGNLSLTMGEYDSSTDQLVNSVQFTVPPQLGMYSSYVYYNGAASSPDNTSVLFTSQNSPQPQTSSSGTSMRVQLWPVYGSSGTVVAVNFYADPNKIYYVNSDPTNTNYYSQTLSVGVGADTAYYVYGGARALRGSAASPVTPATSQSKLVDIAVVPDDSLDWSSLKIATSINSYSCVSPVLSNTKWKWSLPSTATTGLYRADMSYTSN